MKIMLKWRFVLYQGNCLKQIILMAVVMSLYLYDYLVSFLISYIHNVLDVTSFLLVWARSSLVSLVQVCCCWVSLVLTFAVFGPNAYHDSILSFKSWFLLFIHYYSKHTSILMILSCPNSIWIIIPSFSFTSAIFIFPYLILISDAALHPFSITYLFLKTSIITPLTLLFHLAASACK